MQSSLNQVQNTNAEIISLSVKEGAIISEMLPFNLRAFPQWTWHTVSILPVGWEADWSSHIEPVSGTDTDLVTGGIMFCSDILKCQQKSQHCLQGEECSEHTWGSVTCSIPLSFHTMFKTKIMMQQEVLCCRVLAHLSHAAKSRTTPATATALLLLCIG